MPRLRPLMLACTLSMVGAVGHAQSLQEVYEAARGYDAAYLAARAQAESAQFRTEQAYALRRPNVSANGSATQSDTSPPTSTFNPGGDKYNNLVSGVTVNGRLPLFNRANGATIGQAERSLEVARADLQTAEHELIVRSTQLYFDVLVAQDALAAAQANKKAVGEQLASAKRNFEVGTATITDTREAQARFDLGTATEIAAENDLRTKRIALDQLIGRDNVTPRPLATPVALPAVPGAVDEWVGQAQAGHPAVRRADLALDIARLETEKARAGHLPTIDAVASLGTTRVSGGGPSTIGSTTVANVGVQLAMPIFSGYAVQNRIRETLSLEERSRNDVDAARRGVAQATRVAYFGYQSGQAQVAALEAAEASSRLALEATQLGYRVGVRVNLDVLNSQTQLFNTQRDLSRARYEVLLGGLRLRQAAGTLQPADVNAVNTLLSR